MVKSISPLPLWGRVGEREAAHRAAFQPRLIGLSIALLLPAWVLAAPIAKLDRTEIALGEPLTLTVAGPADALEGLDLAPLQQDFLVRGRTLSSADGRGELGLTLYPRRPGRLTLPPLATPAGPTPALAARVADGSADTPRVLFRVEVGNPGDPPRPLARQATRLTVEACDDGSLAWERPVLPTHEGLALRPLGEQEFDTERDGTACTAHRWHWALLPTAAGSLDLALPWLKANRFGRTLLFPPPAAGMEVQPLPGWLPPAAAVGRPQVTAAPLPAAWPLERPLAWRLEITGGYGATEMKDLLRLQLAPHPTFNAYPPMVEMLAPETADSPHARLAVTLYVLPRATGDLALPELGLPWYDPAGGRLESLPIPGPRLSVFNPLHRTLLNGALGLAGAALLALAAWVGWRSLSWRLARRRGLKAIAQANDLSGLMAAVRAFGLTPATKPAPTLGRLLASGNLCAPALDELVMALERAAYGGEGADPALLRARALRVLAQSRPVP